MSPFQLQINKSNVDEILFLKLYYFIDGSNFCVAGSYLPNEWKELFITFVTLVSYWEGEDKA